MLPTTCRLLQTGEGTWTHSDDVIESPGVLDGAAEIQAVEGLSQCTIAVALGELNYGGIRSGRVFSARANWWGRYEKLL